MAIDTAARRKSCIGLGLASLRTGIIPTGSNLSAPERLHADLMYSGIAAQTPGDVVVIGTTDGGPSGAGIGFIHFDGAHQVAGQEKRRFFRLDNPGQETSDGTDGELWVEWRVEAGLSGGSFMVYLGSDNLAVEPVLIGRLLYNRYSRTPQQAFQLAPLAKGPVQYDTLVVPAAAIQAHDGSDFFYVYFAPRDHPQFVYVTGLQLNFSS